MQTPVLPPIPEIKDKTHLIEFEKMRYQAELDLVKAAFEDDLQRQKIEQEQNFEHEKLDLENDYVQAQAVNEAYLEVAKASFERAAARATFVQGAATAVSGAYVGVLALSFVANDNLRLPSSGLAPTIFLGLAIFLSAVYNSFITRPGTILERKDNGLYPDKQLQRRNTFIAWNTRPLLRKKDFLQAAIVSLGIGTIMLPLPYLQIDEGLKWVFVAVGLLYIPVLTHYLASSLEAIEAQEGTEEGEKESLAAQAELSLLLTLMKGLNRNI